MITLIACDKDSSETFSQTINPQTKEEFDRDIQDFEEKANKLFRKWFYTCNNLSATKEQDKWLEEEEIY